MTYVLAVAGQGLFMFRIAPIRYQNVFRLIVRLLQFGGLLLIVSCVSRPTIEEVQIISL